MKYFLSLSFFLLLPPLCLGKAKSGGSVPSTEYTTISVPEANKLIQKGTAILVDVREWEDVKNGMAAPARWMPLSRILSHDRMWADFLETLSKDKLIILYCRSGKRACRAESELAAVGFHTANIGRYSDWTNAGLPIRRP